MLFMIRCGSQAQNVIGHSSSLSVLLTATTFIGFLDVNVDAFDSLLLKVCPSDCWGVIKSHYPIQCVGVIRGKGQRRGAVCGMPGRER